VDPPGPFALIPVPQLESTGNAVIRMMLSNLQQVFIRQLADDYNRWAQDEAYRTRRERDALRGG